MKEPLRSRKINQAINVKLDSLKVLINDFEAKGITLENLYEMKDRTQQSKAA